MSKSRGEEDTWEFQRDAVAARRIGEWEKLFFILHWDNQFILHDIFVLDAYLDKYI